MTLPHLAGERGGGGGGGGGEGGRGGAGAVGGGAGGHGVARVVHAAAQQVVDGDGKDLREGMVGRASMLFFWGLVEWCWA